VITVVWAQLTFRKGRLLATLLAVAIAVASFSMLASVARGSQLRAVGTVRTNYRPIYDILVRPSGAGTGQLPPDALTNTYGGITSDQWQRILALPGVSVAAPVAMVGYVMHTVSIPVDLKSYVPKSGGAPQVLRIAQTWTSDRGLTHIVDGSSYFYATSDAIVIEPGELQRTEYDVSPDGTRRPICNDITHSDGVDPLKPANRDDFVCWSSNPASQDPGSGDPMPATPQVSLMFSVPLLMAAIDPVQEAKLDGLDRAVGSGRYLDERYVPPPAPAPATDRGGPPPATLGIPVLVAAQSQLDEQLNVQIQQLPTGAAARVSAGERLDNVIDDFDASPATTLGRLSVSAQDVYPDVISDLAKQSQLGWDGIADDPVVQNYWTLGQQHLTPNGTLVPVAPAGDEWQPGSFDAPSLSPLPIQLSDTDDSAVNSHGVPWDSDPALGRVTSLHGVGVFDPSKVAQGPSLSSLPTELYASRAAPGADAQSQQALGGKPLLPNDNFAGAIGATPALLTSLSAYTAMQKSPYRNLTAAQGVNAAAPISAVRVRVAGGGGMDALSRERVRAAADAIRSATGLQVDLMPGSSAATVPVTVPAGHSGRPTLTVSESWLREGVASTIVAAVDRKSLLLALMVLVACVLAVGNATSAAIRTRSTELGVLACLGWPAWRLFALVLTESAAVGVAAGVVGTGLAAGVAPVLGVHLQLVYAMLAFPAAVLLTLCAALPSAWRATRADPGNAVRPAVTSTGRRHSPRRIGGLAWANLLRVPGRTALGMCSLAVGVAALTLLAIITLSFRGAVTGTVLGDAITVQVQGTDYVAAAITTLLGLVTVADVLYVNIRARSAEFALLGAVGWTDDLLARLAGWEAAALGFCGSVLGAGVALGLTAALGTTPPLPAYLDAAVAVVAGTLLTIVAAIVPLRTLRALPVAQLLVEE